MRPGNLNGLGNYWFGEAPKKARKVLHPDIYRYNSKHIEPLMRSNNYKRAVKEISEQIYTFDLFTPEFCKKLIEEAEFQGGWSTGIDNESGTMGLAGLGMHADPSLMKSLRTENEKDTTLSLKAFPSSRGLSLINTVNKTSKQHVTPLINRIWKSFDVERYDAPYLLKYEPNKVNKMNLHYDLETVAMVVYLNTEYKGGGTYFPRWKFHSQPKKPGQAAFWPGGVSHEHIGMPITAGVRYLLCCAFF